MIAAEPLVSAVIPKGRELLKVTGRLLGRMTRVQGKPVAAEIEVLEEGTGFYRSTGRVTLVPAKDVEPITDAARALMEDVGGRAAA